MTELEGECPDNCRHLTCGRCKRHTDNTHQGHYWSWCKVSKQIEKFHFCCPRDCEIYGAGTAVTAATGQPEPHDDGQVPLRQRPIPDQLDYFSEKLAALLDTRKLDRDTLIAIGAAVVGLGSAASQLRKQAADQPPLSDEYGMRVTYVSTRTLEAALSDNADEARAIIDGLNHQDNGEERRDIISRELIKRKVSDWKQVDGD